MKRRGIVESGRPLGALLTALSVFAPGAGAQENDVLPPPRLDAPANARVRSQPAAPTRVPDGARLAPLPEERAPTEEIIVLGENEWRLPDLGSSWRAEREAEESPDGIQTTFLPLYDPENPPARSDIFLLNREAQRLGFVEIFRLRFGRRSTD